MYKVLLSTILFFFPVFINAGDIDKGYQAYNNKNYKEAYQHWIIPADAGDKISQYNIALLYFFGNGVKKNLEIAFQYCRKSALQDLPRAQNNLAFMYADGLGVKQNYILSYKWAYLAYMNGYPSNKLLNKSKNKLNDSDLKKANKLIGKYLRRNKNEK
tara:strand:+ start:16871 stop:17344 length:474 start_codon:yes stop_codon:yes gene_type:complete